jgi:adenylate cyclase
VRSLALNSLGAVREEIEGALDPQAPDLALRRFAADYLIGAGVPADDVVEIISSRDFLHAANVRLLLPGGRASDVDSEHQIGLSIDQLDRIRRAAGLTPTDTIFEDYAVSPEVEEVLSSFAAGAALLGEAATLQFVRVMGAAVAQVAEAAVALFGSRITGPLNEQRASPEVQLQAALDGTRSLSGVGRALDVLFRFHALTAIRRLDRARSFGTSFDYARLAVGFIDLVGFTPLSEQLDSRELSDMFDEFETFASDVITEHDARLVKLIGDAIMFVSLDIDAACDIALTLLERFTNDADRVTPRGALAFGDMLIRGGDYYGPVVNVAARAADLAIPYEILVTDEIVRGIGANYVAAPAGRRQLKGVTEPVALSTLNRSDVTSLAD